MTSFGSENSPIPEVIVQKIWGWQRQRDRARTVRLVLAALAGVSWILGFALGEDSSGGARFDFLNTHWPASKMFADAPFLMALREDPSATPPLHHMLMAALPWVHDEFAYRLTGFAFGTAVLVAFAIAVRRRFALVWPDGSLALLATGAVALSPGLRSASFWGNTDVLPLLFTALTALLLRDRSTGTWHSSATPTRIGGVALLSAAAFYTRQNFIFLPLFSFWILAVRSRAPLVPLCFTFGLTAVPALALFRLWRGLTPPAVQAERMHALDQLASGSAPDLTSFVYLGAMVAPFALPFLVARKSPPGRWKPILLGYCVLGAVLFLCFRHMQLSPLGGGAVTKLGLLLGPAGLPVVLALAALGWCCIGAALAASADNAVLFGFAAFPLLVIGALYQRYLDPLAFILVLLLASPPLAPPLVTERSVVASYMLFMFFEVMGILWYMLLGHT
ncbi:MAG: hypothetical protein JO212_03310 [Acetobacteraceae bacterium]|nr:hypothetical protein [Acetobacteraceae bacterium]